jgi:N-acetylglucosaminyldiphosphoundecaprenol N-acetyl-beta-D-mannosaminyltransferase
MASATQAPRRAPEHRPRTSARPRVDAEVLARLELALLATPPFRTPQAGRRAPMPECPGRAWIMGVPVDAVTQRQTVDRVFAALEWGRGGWVMTPNLDILRTCQRDAELRGFARTADLVVADGQPVVWASRIAGSPLPERVAGSDLIVPLCRMAARAGRSVFLLGANPGTADAAAERLAAEAPGLRVAGTHCPPFGFEECEDERALIRRRLLDARPDIVLVALGAPKQERLIRELRPLLPRAWFFGVGISLSFVTGEVRRAPALLRAAGLEWAHRLAQEPRRLCSRYLRDGLPFAARLGLWALRRRLAPDLRRRRGAPAAAARMAG